MRKPKTFTVAEVFNAMKVGATFEFYSSKDMALAASELSHLTASPVLVTNEAWQNPERSQSVLYREYEGAKPRYAFKLAPRDYASFTPILNEVLGWIDATATTTRDTTLRFNISVDSHRLATLESVSTMCPSRLLTRFNESYVWERFPERQNSPHVNSVEWCHPTAIIEGRNRFGSRVSSLFEWSKGPHWGISFEEISRGWIQFNYVGGPKYARKRKEVSECLQYYALRLYAALNEVEDEPKARRASQSAMQRLDALESAYYEPKEFTALFPDIRVAVDMKTDEQLVKTYWTIIRDPLFEITISGRATKGEFNWDTDASRPQFRLGEFRSAGIKGFDIVNSKLSGIFKECRVWTSDAKGVLLQGCTLIRDNDVSESLLLSTSSQAQNVIKESFVENTNEILNCTIEHSVVKFAGIGAKAALDESTVVVLQNQPNPVVNRGVEVEQIRDYRWLKNLLGAKPEGHRFENEYIKKNKKYDSV